MSVELVLWGLCIAGAVVLLPPTLYLLFLTVVGLFYRTPASALSEPVHRFALLVPAHNEELLLPQLLESLRRVEYPSTMFRIFVVADNCSDSTAQVARSFGASVYERSDTVRLGKGYALQWLLQQIRPESAHYDACVVLDADSIVSPNFLSVMDGRFQSGSVAVQSYYQVGEPFDSPVSTLRFTAFVLKHYVRSKGRLVLDLSCGLFGTGMAFKREILDAFGWDAFTLAEDVEFYLKLTKNRIKVDFAPEAMTWSQMPPSLKEARSQNLRWEKGRLQMAWRYGPRFFFDGMFRGELRKLDAAIEQAIPPLSVVALAALVLLGLTVLTGSPWMIILGVAVNLGLLAHILVGLFSAGVPLRSYTALAFVPAFILWKCYLYVLAFLPGSMQWVRTGRPAVPQLQKPPRR